MCVQPSPRTIDGTLVQVSSPWPVVCSLKGDHVFGTRFPSFIKPSFIKPSFTIINLFNILGTCTTHIKLRRDALHWTGATKNVLSSVAWWSNIHHHTPLYCSNIPGTCATNVKLRRDALHWTGATYNVFSSVSWWSNGRALWTYTTPRPNKVAKSYPSSPSSQLCMLNKKHSHKHTHKQTTFLLFDLQNHNKTRYRFRIWCLFTKLISAWEYVVVKRSVWWSQTQSYSQKKGPFSASRLAPKQPFALRLH